MRPDANSRRHIRNAAHHGLSVRVAGRFALRTADNRAGSGDRRRDCDRTGKTCAQTETSRQGKAKTRAAAAAAAAPSATAQTAACGETAGTRSGARPEAAARCDTDTEAEAKAKGGKTSQAEAQEGSAKTETAAEGKTETAQTEARFRVCSENGRQAGAKTAATAKTQTERSQEAGFTDTTSGGSLEAQETGAPAGSRQAWDHGGRCRCDPTSNRILLEFASRRPRCAQDGC